MEIILRTNEVLKNNIDYSKIKSVKAVAVGNHCHSLELLDEAINFSACFSGFRKDGKPIEVINEEVEIKKNDLCKFEKNSSDVCCVAIYIDITDHFLKTKDMEYMIIGFDKFKCIHGKLDYTFTFPLVEVDLDE